MNWWIVGPAACRIVACIVWWVVFNRVERVEDLPPLSVPGVPLHNNASELQARVSARRRDVSLHSRSVRGARSMDIFTTLVQTAKILGVSAYA